LRAADDNDAARWLLVEPLGHFEAIGPLKVADGEPPFAWL
jgi:hypothetical protein